MALTKDDIINKLVKEYKLKRREAKDLVDTFFDDIKTRVSRRASKAYRNGGFLFEKRTLPKKTKEHRCR